ncbi:MAG: flavodoxin [Oscillospiraceae bacterium]|nr:flavodoxin [Oscillospiraceae bacterium]
MSKTLIAYFSASGQTEKLAKTLAEVLGADIYAIKPETPYTREDLDWTTKKSRSSIEMADSSFRPPLAENTQGMEAYGTIFVGFPIWWYVAPTIINTFLESFDTAGKTIIPFATSGGSGMGKTNAALKPSCPESRLLEGRVFKAGASAVELKSWVESLGL